MSIVIRIYQQLNRLQFLFSRKRHSELDEELSFHLEQSTHQKIASGLSPEEARRQALIEFGGVERTRNQCYEQRPSLWIETVGQDVRYALRGFRRSPIFTVTILVTLALGIGSTTAVFSVVDPILFRSLPYGRADQLVSVGLTAPINPQEFMLGGSYYDWRDNQKPFESFAAEGVSNPCDLTENNAATSDMCHCRSRIAADSGCAARSRAKLSSGRRQAEWAEGGLDLVWAVAQSL